MPKFRVHYTGEHEEIVEAEGSILAEMEANERNSDCWIAEEFEDGDEEEVYVDGRYQTGGSVA